MGLQALRKLCLPNDYIFEPVPIEVNFISNSSNLWEDSGIIFWSIVMFINLEIKTKKRAKEIGEIA